MIKQLSNFAARLTVLSSRMCEKPVCDMCFLLGPRIQAVDSHEFMFPHMISVASATAAAAAAASPSFLLGKLPIAHFAATNHKEIIGWVAWNYSNINAHKQTHITVGSEYADWLNLLSL